MRQYTYGKIKVEKILSTPCKSPIKSNYSFAITLREYTLAKDNVKSLMKQFRDMYNNLDICQYDL